MLNGKFLTLGIETSCDETSAAVVADGREVLSNIIASQADLHKIYGGVVPEIASRRHLEQINFVTGQALSEAGAGFSDVDLIGVTKGPGLVGALLIGVATAKAFAYANAKPLVGVHHILGHISANYIEHKGLAPPFAALIASGGHTGIAEVLDYNHCRFLGKTRDDAAGEAFDKVARILGLGYPGGPLIDAIAKKGDPEAVYFKRTYLEKDSFDFSFSGIKTGVLQYVNTEKQMGRAIRAADVAAGFQMSIVEVIAEKALRAAKLAGKGRLVLAGGVAANSLLRANLSEACEKNGISLYFPSPGLCTDNAAMIGCAAYYRYQAGMEDDLTLDAHANLEL